MPGLTREIQLIDETDIIKSRLKEQTSGGKGKPWFERKHAPKLGNGGYQNDPTARDKNQNSKRSCR